MIAALLEALQFILYAPRAAGRPAGQRGVRPHRHLRVVKRIVCISGGIAHAAYGGIGLGYYFKYMILPVLFAGSAAARDPRPGYWPLLGAIVFSLLAAAIMGWIQRRTRQRADTIIGVLWAIGMATGILLVDPYQGYKVDLMSYLFGQILAVERTELLVIAGLDVLVVGLGALFYKELLAVSFDETFATCRTCPWAASMAAAGA